MKNHISYIVCLCLCMGCSLPEVPECVEGMIECRDTISGGILKICEQHQWQDYKQCTNIFDEKISVSCKNDRECSQCDDNICVLSSDDRMSYTWQCVDHEYSDKNRQRCAVKCQEDGLNCSNDQCVSGESHCYTEGNKLNYIVCQDGSFINMFCPFCRDENTCGECEPGTSTCKTSVRPVGKRSDYIRHV